MVLKANSNFLIEVSWEVCNKVGGIYTVITSKTQPIQKYYGKNYLLIGPYFDEKARGVFTEEVPPAGYKSICAELEKLGIFCHYGTWNTGGMPKVILIDFLKCYNRMNQIKGDLWNVFKIDSLNAGQDYDEPIVWSWAVGKLIEQLAVLNKDKKIVAHFHEWLAGVGLLELKKNNVNVATVFTTHATILGRTLASSDIDLYGANKEGVKYLDQVDPLKEAYNYHIESKYLVEQASAKNANVFTTVSEITGIEAAALLKRKPDVLLPNGLDMRRFPTFEELSIKHSHNKHHIKEFLMTYFFPHYTFDLNNTLIYFLAGRYEFRDKGIDIYLKALAQLNDRMKRSKSKKHIVAFIWVPAGVRGIKKDLLISRTLFNDIKESVHNRRDIIENKLIYNILVNKELNKANLLGSEATNELKIKTSRFIIKSNPPLCTHDLFDENDQVKRTLNEAGLDNQPDDRVKVIFYPIYLTGADNLLDLNYYESINGSHLGVFPSFYEPWGYTPLETGALGVASVTTDLAGFGRFIEKKKKEKKNGIFVLERLNKTDDEIVKSLADFMYWFQSLDAHFRVKNKIEARRLAEMADWNILVQQYIKAHNLAIKRAYK